MKLSVVLALLALPAFGQRVDIHLDPGATVVQWTLGDVLHTVHGTFKLRSAELWVNPENGQAGGSLVVDAASGESGSNARDGRMHRNVLESSRFPDITFVPDRLDGKLALTGDSEVGLHGTLTIHGASHELVLKVKSHIEQQKLGASASFTVPYVKWGMKDPSNFLLKVKDFVEIAIKASGNIQ